MYTGTAMLRKSRKSLPCNLVSILLLEKRPGLEIWTWWRQAKEINDIFAFSEGFADGLGWLLVHLPASQPFRD